MSEAKEKYTGIYITRRRTFLGVQFLSVWFVHLLHPRSHTLTIKDRIAASPPCPVARKEILRFWTREKEKMYIVEEIAFKF